MVLVSVLVLGGLAVGLSPAAVARTPMGTTSGVRTEGSASDPVIIVDPRRGPVGTTVHVTARCGPPLRLIQETFRRPANFESLGQPELLGSDPHTFVNPSEGFEFRGDFEVPATLEDAVTGRPVPVLPGWYLVDVRCHGALDARGYVIHTDLRAFFCVPECLPRSFAMFMNVHLESSGSLLQEQFRTLTLLSLGFIPPPIVATTTTRPRAHAPQPSPPPPTEPPTTTTTKPCSDPKKTPPKC